MKSEGKAHLTGEELAEQLIERLGGPHAALEQISVVLGNGIQITNGGSCDEPNEATPGYCYLRLFDRIEHRDAALMGLNPTVADLRRFSNGRTDPFGSRDVVVTVQNGEFGRVAHIEYCGGRRGLRPVAALAALAKDLRVGALPDGVSEEFPPVWIPARRVAYQTWNYTMDKKQRNLDILSWLGDDPIPDSSSKGYEPISSPHTRVRWTVRASPVGPSTARVDIIDREGSVKVAKSWTSYVAPYSYYQEWSVRGSMVFVEVEVWRPAKMTTTPGAPMPTPPSQGGEHGELFRKTVVGNDLRPDLAGYCYVDMVRSDMKCEAMKLGPCPTVADLWKWLCSHADNDNSLVEDGWIVAQTGNNLYHIVAGEGDAQQLLGSLENLPLLAHVGATQADAVRLGAEDNVAEPARLTVRPRGSYTRLVVPFAAKLDMDKPQLFWTLSGGRKLDTLLSYFESAELVSMRIKATVHKGDGDTLLSVAVDTVATPFKEEMDWIAASHTLHVSGNRNGATNGELVIEGNHGFGTQLRGVSVGNATPVVQVLLETNVAANAYIKVVLVLQVAGTGVPTAIVLPTRAQAGGNRLNRVMESESDEEEGNLPATANSSKRR